MTPLASEEVDTALEALPGWRRYGEFLAREVPVQRGAHEGLIAGLRNVVEDEARFNVIDTPDGVIVYLGNDTGVLPSDIETAARLDTVLDGSGTQM